MTAWNINIYYDKAQEYDDFETTREDKKLNTKHG